MKRLQYPDNEEVTAIRKRVKQAGCPKNAVRYEVVSELRRSGYTEKVSLVSADPGKMISRSSYRSYLSRRLDREAKQSYVMAMERTIQKYHSDFPCWGAKKIYFYIKQREADVSYSMVKRSMKLIGNSKRVILMPFSVPKDRTCKWNAQLITDDPSIVWGWNEKEVAQTPGEVLLSDSTCLFDSTGEFIAEVVLIWDLWTNLILSYSFNYMKDDLEGFVHSAKRLSDSIVRILPSTSTIHTDNGRCFISERYNAELNNLGVIHRVSIKGHPTSNSVAEALIGQVKREFTDMFIEPACEHTLPFDYWEKAFDQYVSFFNIIRIVVKFGISPLEKFNEWQQSQIMKREVMYGNRKTSREGIQTDQ